MNEPNSETHLYVGCRNAPTNMTLLKMTRTPKNGQIEVLERADHRFEHLTVLVVQVGGSTSNQSMNEN